MLKRLVLLVGLLALSSSAAVPQQRPMSLNTVNGSVAISTGLTFQTVLAANARRQSLTIQNNNTNGDNCWIFVGSGAATTANSILLGPGGSYQRYAPYLPADPIQATCTTTNDTLYIDTQ